MLSSGRSSSPSSSKCRTTLAARRGVCDYGFFAAVEDPLSFIAVEEWADREALDRHFAEPHLQEFTGRLLELISTTPEIAIHEVADTKPFPGRGD